MERQCARIEGELLPLAEPSRNPWLEPARNGFPHVEKCDSRPAEQPLEAARDQGVDSGVLHIDRNLPNRLVCIDETQRAVRMRDVRDALDVLDRASREVHV